MKLTNKECEFLLKELTGTHDLMSLFEPEATKLKQIKKSIVSKCEVELNGKN